MKEKYIDFVVELKKAGTIWKSVRGNRETFMPNHRPKQLSVSATLYLLSCGERFLIGSDLDPIRIHTVMVLHH